MSNLIKKLCMILELIVDRIRYTYLYTILVSLILYDLGVYLDKIGDLEYTLSYYETFHGVCWLFIYGCILYTFINELSKYIKNKYKSFIEK